MRVIVRETFASSLEMGEPLLTGPGSNRQSAREIVTLLRAYDEALLEHQRAVHRDEEAPIPSACEAVRELKNLFDSDLPAARRTSSTGETDRAGSHQRPNRNPVQ
ncbi:MAG: hypothetical protein U5K33_08865 [Halofilum sp. (in: g-proteobacteria)]|nr:hypothetical protein [Halofilum sp. (in: g-proteobacteria)]